MSNESARAAIVMRGVDRLNRGTELILESNRSMQSILRATKNISAQFRGWTAKLSAVEGTSQGQIDQAKKSVERHFLGQGLKFSRDLEDAQAELDQTVRLALTYYSRAAVDVASVSPESITQMRDLFDKLPPMIESFDFAIANTESFANTISGVNEAVLTFFDSLEMSSVAQRMERAVRRVGATLHSARDLAAELYTSVRHLEGRLSGGDTGPADETSLDDEIV